jgi:hypothetical protein
MNSIESLESRRLLSGTPGLPSLSGVLTLKKTTISAPGQKVSAILTVTNNGGDTSKLTVPIGIYATDELITTLTPSLTIKNGQTKKIAVKVTIPATDILPNGDFSFSAIINDGNTISEVSGTDDVASATLFNPIGSYTGFYQVGTDQNSLDITVFMSDGKFESDVDADGASFGTLSDAHAKTTITSTGKFSTVAIGSNPSHNVSKFVIPVKGTVNTSNETISGPFSFSGKGTGGAFKGKGTFSITEEVGN